MKERERWLDYAKGFACFLVVYCHVVRGIINANIINTNLFLDFLDYAIYLFHMPLFFIISGYLYEKSKKINGIKDYFRFAVKKIINLGIPYLAFSIIFILLNYFASGTNSEYSLKDIIYLYKTPIAHFWFLYDLIIIFLLIPILERLIKNKKALLIFLLIGKVIFTIFNLRIALITSFFNDAFYFYIGNYLIKNINKNKVKLKTKCLIGISFVGLSIICYVFENNNLYIFIQFVLKIVLAILGSYGVLSIIKKNNGKILGILGKYSFQIYLMHTIFSAFIRIVLIKFEIYNFFIHFAFGMIFGIGIPIVISIISNRIVYTNIFIFPQKTFKQIKNKKEIKYEK